MIVSATNILEYSIIFSLAMMMLALVLTCLRVIVGPTLADRILALDQLVAIAIGFIAMIALKTGYFLYIDIALALGLVGFLATASLARYIFIRRSRSEESTEGAQEPLKTEGQTRT